MNKLIPLTLLLVCIVGLLSQSAEAQQGSKTDYSITILDISPAGESIDKPSDVTAIFGAKKITGTGSSIKSDGKIPITVTKYVDLSWEPKAYTPSSITNTYGSSLGSTSDTDKRDRMYYTVTAEDISDNENESLYATNFTFNIDVPAAYRGKVKDMYVTLYVKSPAGTNKLMMYTGSVWNTVRTFDSTSGETIEFLAGREYAQSSQVKIMMYSEDDSSYDIDVDVVNVMFRYSGMDVTFNAPSGAKVAGLDDYHNSETEIDYTQPTPASAILDLSDYTDFDNKDYQVNFIYSYNLTISNYALEQKTKSIISSEDKTTSLDLNYEKYFKLTAPFPQEINLQASPQTSLEFNGLTNSSRSYEVTKEDEKISFDIDTSNTVNLTYTLKNAFSLKKELYKQVTSGSGALQWVSRYWITRNYNSSLGPVILSHRLITNSSDYAIIVDPPEDYTGDLEGSNLSMVFPDIAERVAVTITENSNRIMTNHSSSVQVTNPLPVGTSPTFRATIDFSNPTNREMKLNLSKEMILSVLPELEEYLKEVPGEISSITLKAGESRTVPLVFNTSAAAMNESQAKQTIVAVNQPVEWAKTIKVTNPSEFDYANVTWTSEVPDEISGYTVNGGDEKESSGNQVTYLIDKLPAGETQDYRLLYYTLPVKKTEEVISSGMIDKVIEKTVTLNNPNSEDVKVIAGFNISDLPNLKLEDLESQLVTYKLEDRDGDGVSDYVRWETVVEAKDEKVVVLNSTSGDIMKSIPSVNLNTDSINLSALSLGGDNVIPMIFLGSFFGIVLVFLFVIRIARKNRRRRMILYIAGTNDAIRSLGGGQKHPAPKQ